VKKDSGQKGGTGGTKPELVPSPKRKKKAVALQRDCLMVGGGGDYQSTLLTAPGKTGFEKREKVGKGKKEAEIHGLGVKSTAQRKKKGRGLQTRRKRKKKVCRRLSRRRPGGEGRVNARSQKKLKGRKKGQPQSWENCQ